MLVLLLMFCFYHKILQVLFFVEVLKPLCIQFEDQPMLNASPILFIYLSLHNIILFLSLMGTESNLLSGKSFL